MLGVVGDVEPRSRRGNTSEGKRQERIVLWSPANPGSGATDSAGAQILEAARARVARPKLGNGVEGKDHRKVILATAKGKPLETMKPRGATGMKQGWKGGSGTKRQEVEKTWRRN